MRVEYCLLQGLIAPLGLAAVFIGSMIVVTGVLNTLHFFESTYAIIFSLPAVLEPQSVTPTIDNEFRFYAILWISYGVLSLWVSRHIESEFRLVPYLLGIFFAGGIAREPLIRQAFDGFKKQPRIDAINTGAFPTFYVCLPPFGG